MDTDDTKCHSVLDTESIDAVPVKTGIPAPRFCGDKFRRNDICVIAVKNLRNLR